MWREAILALCGFVAIVALLGVAACGVLAWQLLATSSLPF